MWFPGWQGLYHSAARVREKVAHSRIALRLLRERSPMTAQLSGLNRRRQEAPDGQPITMKEKTAMRSDLVFGALSHVSNRYQLCQLASKATRKLHKPNTRLQDTTNEVLGRFRTSDPAQSAAEETAAQPVERRRAA
jgi:hypothetical protein